MKSYIEISQNPKYYYRPRKYRVNSIGNTRRVERTLKLIQFLNTGKTIRQIAKHLEIHEKSVNRYLNLLVQLGFIVEWATIKGGYHIYRVSNAKEYFNIE